MKIAYIKNGDAVKQVKRYASSAKLARSGPDAFLSDFLSATSGEEVMVLCRIAKSMSFQQPGLKAIGVSSGFWITSGIVYRIVTALKIFGRIVAWRPSRILCGCTGELLWASVLAGRLTRATVVNSRHNMLSTGRGWRAIGRHLDSICMRACHGIVCHGPYLVSEISNLGIAQEKIFEFEVDLSGFSTVRAEDLQCESLDHFIAEHRFIITFVGRIQTDKGVFDLLSAFNSISQRHSGVGLIIAGTGKHIGDLRTRVTASRARNSIMILGELRHNNLPWLLKRSTLVATPTRPEFPEGRCMVVLESQVAGLPVVAPKFGPFPYAIQHDVNGLLFKPGDGADLTACLDRLISDVSLLKNLQQGAKEAGRRLLTNRTGFATAVMKAFTLPRPEVGRDL